MRPGSSLLARHDRSAGSARRRHRLMSHASDILPWFTHNALIHYLAPRGLEQYSGGGWGTRDVCQGPVELLLALGRSTPLRDLLLRVFANQNADGDWPQWFMFFDRERGIRPADSHGDIVFWPVLALAAVPAGLRRRLDSRRSAPFFDPGGDAKARARHRAEHVERALALIERRVIPGTRLAAYGHGDWNDSLQPADPAMPRAVQRVDSHAASPDDRDPRASAAPLGVRGVRREARGHTGRHTEQLPASAPRRRSLCGPRALSG